jgi:hypothetical protein
LYLSPDGQVLLAHFHSRITDKRHPAIWTLQDGWWYLKRDGGLTRNPREAIWGYAKSISYDGSVVLGYDLAARRSFRWRRGRGVEHLQRPPGASVAVGDFLSWDGGWVGRRVAFPGAYDIAPEEDLIEPRAFLWEEGRGWVDLNEVYGWLFGENIAESAGISANGRYLVVSILTPPLPGGYRLGAEGILDRFGVHGDVTGDDCVDDADLLRVLFAFGREGWRPEDVNVDRVVNEQDLLIVLSGFGECAN